MTTPADGCTQTQQSVSGLFKRLIDRGAKALGRGGKARRERQVAAVTTSLTTSSASATIKVDVDV